VDELPPGTAALDAILEVRACGRAHPSWIGVQDRRELRDPDAQYAVHRRLLGTARAAGPLRIALARVAAAFLARETWKRLAFVRLSDYARERLGISSRDLQELGRVGAKLESLPELEAALAEGRVCWSKARLVARVATPSDERQWIRYAEQVSTSTVAEKVRKLEAETHGSSAEPTDDEGTLERFFQLACSARVRGQWHRVRQLAHRVAGRRVSAADCIDMLTAEVRSAIPVYPEAPDDAPERRGASWSRVIRAARPPTDLPAPNAFDDSDGLATAGDTALSPHLSRSLRALVEGLQDAGPWELDRRLRACLRREQCLDSQLGALLSIVDERRVFRAYDYSSATRYAEERLGVSQRKAQMLLRIERAVRACPPLASAYRGGKISWVQADLLVPLVFADPLGRWWDRWIGWARRVTVRRLREDVEHALLIREIDPEKWTTTGGLPSAVGCDREAGRTAQAKTCAASIGFSSTSDIIEAFWATLWTVRRQIEGVSGLFPTEGEAFEVMMDHVLDEWGADAEVQKPHRIMERDGWRCLVPGCSSRRNLHVHHIVSRSQGGGDEESNLVTLCVFHHLRGVHGGTVEITGKAPDDLVFKLGVRPDGPPLVVYRSGDLLVETS
jgi:hypothetical protein